MSEAIKSPFDEGVKLFVYHFITQLAKAHTVLGLAKTAAFDGDIAIHCKRALPANPFFVSPFLRKKIRGFKPDLIYYIPTACATIYSFLRAKVLKIYGDSSKTVMITLQPRDYSAISRKMIPIIAPDVVLAQSLKTQEALATLGCKTRIIHTGVDLQRFSPVNRGTKHRLRLKYCLPTDKYIILHVGHINRNRNAQFMEQTHSIEGVQAVVVGSTTYPEDSALVQRLRKNGVIIITGYLKHIEEVYQCADCYVFPVFSESACIETPLSILEAMACNLPVVTTKYGSLPHLIKEQNGFMYASSEEDIMMKIDLLKGLPSPTTRHQVEHYSWENVAQSILASSLS